MNAWLIMHEVVAHTGELIAQVGNPSAQAPPGLSSKVETIFGWVKWGALAAIVITMVAGAGLVAVGKMSSNYGAGNLGAKAIIGSIIGAVLYAVGYTLVITLAG